MFRAYRRGGVKLQGDLRPAPLDRRNLQSFAKRFEYGVSKQVRNGRRRGPEAVRKFAPNSSRSSSLVIPAILLYVRKRIFSLGIYSGGMRMSSPRLSVVRSSDAGASPFLLATARSSIWQ